ncbi:MAG: hypothetical protein ACOYNS_01160 [Bacteroidota bacterium]
MMNILMLVLIGIGTLLAGSKRSHGAQPIDYVVTTKASVMTIALNGDVSWSESVSGNSFTVTVAGEAKDFIVKRMNYNFRDGAVKTFSMVPVHPDTERIVITLRKDQAYRIYQSPTSGRLNIEFFSGSAIAASENKPAAAVAPIAMVKQKHRVTEKPVKSASKSAPIDIAKIVKEQTVNAPEPKRNVAAVTSGSKQNEESIPQNTASMSAVNSSAILLLFASMFIITGGGVALGYVLIKRKNVTVPVAAAAPVSIPAPAVIALPTERASAEKEKEEEEFRQAIEYAEQYLRSQGEYELQQRLEKLNSSSMQKKLERASSAPGKNVNTAAAAEKLGISVGEVELASRLQRLQDHHMTENV